MKSWKTCLVLLASGTLTTHAATKSDAPIGLVVSDAAFQINTVRTVGTASVFSGNQVESGDAASLIHLQSGADLKVAPHSVARVFADHAILSSGTLSSQIGGGYTIRAEQYLIQPKEKSTADVQISENKVTVGVPAGMVEVANDSGMVLSKIMRGNTLSFSNSGEVGFPLQQIRIMGVLSVFGNHFLVRDRYTNMVNELAGDVPKKEVGRLITVDGEIETGKAEVSSADRVVKITRILHSDASIGAPCVRDGFVGKKDRVELKGLLAKQQDRYVVTNSDQQVYEVVGDVSDSQVGKKVHLSAIKMENRQPTTAGDRVAYVEHRKFVYFDSPCAGLITGGTFITAGTMTLPAGAASAVAASRPQTPISF